MSSKIDLQEHQFSKFLDSRKKLDAQYVENAADILSEKKEDSLTNNSRPDYRRSLAWDSAFLTSPGVLEPEELFETLNFRPLKSLEQEKESSICQVDSRRSLAWDSAFLTSAGVLDPEELCLVNKGYKESGLHLVPDSAENGWRSAMSDSTIKNDGSSLARLEIDLFDDLKVSSRDSSKSVNGAPSDYKTGRALKNSNASSRAKMKSTPASIKQNVNTNGSERIIKSASLPSEVQRVSRSRHCSPSSSLKPQKVSGRANSPSAYLKETASFGPKHTRMEGKATKAASGQYVTVSKRPCLAYTSSVPNSVSSSKATKGASGQYVPVSERPCLAYTSIVPNSVSSSKSPCSIFNSPINESAALGSAQSASTGRPPLSSKLAASSSPYPLRLNSSLPSHLLSSFKSLCISSSGSIDKQSSKSIASVSQIPGDTGSLGTAPCRRISVNCDAPQASDSDTNHNGQCCSRHENQDTRIQNQNPSRKTRGSSSVLKNVSRNIKYSGLPMPSPKIGFFDVENSTPSTPNDHLKFHPGVEGSSSKTGRVTGNHNGATNRAIHSKLKPSETSLGTGNVKLGPAQTRQLSFSRSAPLKENRATQGLITSRNGTKSEGKQRLQAKTQSLVEHKKILYMLDEDKENLSSFHNQQV